MKPEIKYSNNPHDQNMFIKQYIADVVMSDIGFSKEGIRYINQYVGGGGMVKYGANYEDYGKGFLSEYYTPLAIVEKMVGLAYEHGFRKGPVLEPSCGVGRFLRYFNPDEELDAYEISNISYQIAKATYPTFNIELKDFSSIFTDRRKSLNFRPKYNLVIGNPPYGKFGGKYAGFEANATGANNLIDYFITRGLDLLLPGGLLIYIIGTEPKNGGVPFLRQQNTKIKESISAKADLVDAYRLPAKVFDHTEVLSEIIVLRKK